MKEREKPRSNAARSTRKKRTPKPKTTRSSRTRVAKRKPTKSTRKPVRTSTTGGRSPKKNEDTKAAPVGFDRLPPANRLKAYEKALCDFVRAEAEDLIPIKIKIRAVHRTRVLILQSLMIHTTRLKYTRCVSLGNAAPLTSAASIYTHCVFFKRVDWIISDCKINTRVR